MEPVNEREELIEDQKQNLRLLRQQLEKLKIKLTKINIENMKLHIANSQFAQIIKQQQQKDTDRNRLVAEWTEEDEVKNKSHPSWRYIKPYSVVLQDLQERHPRILEILETARELEEERTRNLEDEKEKSKSAQVTYEIHDVTSDEDLRNYLLGRPTLTISTITQGVQTETEPNSIQHQEVQCSLEMRATGTSNTTNMGVQCELLVPIAEELSCSIDTPSTSGVPNPNLHPFRPFPKKIPFSQTQHQTRPCRPRSSSPESISEKTSVRLEPYRRESSCLRKSPSPPITPETRHKPQQIPSLLHMKMEAHWLQVDARAVCWNCESRDHMFLECTQPRRRIFCHRCGEPGVKIANCPNCKKKC